MVPFKVFISKVDLIALYYHDELRSAGVSVSKPEMSKIMKTIYAADAQLKIHQPLTSPPRKTNNFEYRTTRFHQLQRHILFTHFYAYLFAFLHYNTKNYLKIYNPELQNNLSS